jgi:hypothetical protein
VPVLGEVWTHVASLTLLLVIEVPVLGEVWTHDTSLTPLLVIEVCHRSKPLLVQALQ